MKTMSRPPRFHEENRPYFVTTSTVQRRPIFRDPDQADLLKTVLYQTRERYGFLLLGFVVMPDHLHAVVVPRPGDTISQVMRFIKGTYARFHNRRLAQRGPVWQASFYDRAIRDEKALLDVTAYMEGNPVRAGLAMTAQMYPFSSAHRDCATDLEAYLSGQA